MNPPHKPIGSERLVIFTIVSANYLAYAITLMRSVAVHHPGARRVVALVDRIVDGLDWPRDLFEVVPVEELPLPRMRQFLFRYEIMELNTAVKPYVFQWLADQDPSSQIVYLDPDILVVSPLDAVTRSLTDGHLAVVTPHLTAPLEDDRLPDELAIMRVGTYNLGFIAMGPHPARVDLIRWWGRKLEFGAYVDVPAGLFTDQKWVDLIPGMFPDVRILRDPGYNLAYWNLAHRPVTVEDGVLHAGGQRLAFVHFSGVEPHNPHGVSKHQNRFTAEDLGPLRPLYDGYLAALHRNGYEKYTQCRYAYGFFADGTPISRDSRATICKAIGHELPADVDPFDLGAAWLDGKRGGSTVQPVESRNALMALDGDAFVIAAYHTLLHRHPDGARLTLGESMTKDEMIEAILASDEFQNRAIELPQGFERDEAPPASFLDLLRLEGETFVVLAYRTVLRREPDASGLAYHLEALGRGQSKAVIVRGMLESDEGRAQGTPFPDLHVLETNQPLG